MALEAEVRYFEAQKQELLRHHEGKFAVVIGERLLGVFDTHEEAYKAGLAEVGNQPMLIKQILRVARGQPAARADPDGDGEWEDVHRGLHLLPAGQAGAACAPAGRPFPRSCRVERPYEYERSYEGLALREAVSMRIRSWSGARVTFILSVAWLTAVALMGVASEVTDVGPIFVGLLVLSILLLVVPSVIATLWVWNRTGIGRWHPGKLVILWGLCLGVAFLLRRIEAGLEVWPLLLGGIPLLALTWSWLSAREPR